MQSKGKTDTDEQESRCSYEHQRVKRRYVGHVEQTMDIPEWVRCVLEEGHEGEHEYD